MKIQYCLARLLYLFVCVLMLCCGCGYKGSVIEYQDVKALVYSEDAMKTTAIIDARSHENWAAGYIDYAINIEQASFVDAFCRLVDNGSALTSMVPDKAAKLVIYGSGNDTAWQVAAAAEQLGYSDVNFYEGGITDWKSHGEYLVLAYDAFKAWYDKNCPFQDGENYLVDVNPHDLMYINYGHIPAAINIMSDYFTTRYGIPDQGKALTEVITNKQAMVVFYCASPACPSSRLSSQAAVKLGYSNIFRFHGGIQEWVDEGNQIIKADEVGSCAP